MVGMLVAADKDHFYVLVPMFGNNYRLVLSPLEDISDWTYGWCYEGDLAPMLALRVWDPQTENEPVGWKKRPTARIRIAPDAAAKPEYNRPRCVHGNYMADRVDWGCRTAPNGCPGVMGD
jgi:hypothetical protein